MKKNCIKLTLLITIFLHQGCCEKQKEVPCYEPDWEKISLYIPKNIKLNDYWIFKETLNNITDTVKIVKYKIKTIKQYRDLSKKVICRKQESQIYDSCYEVFELETSPFVKQRILSVKTFPIVHAVPLSEYHVNTQKWFFMDSVTVQNKTYHNITIGVFQEQVTYVSDTIWFAKDIGPVKWKISNLPSISNNNYNFERL